MEMCTHEPTIIIMIGGGRCLALDQYNNLLIYDRYYNDSVNLGPLTQQRAKEISKHLNCLATHTPER